SMAELVARVRLSDRTWTCKYNTSGHLVILYKAQLLSFIEYRTVPRSGMLALFGQHYLAALYPSTSKISLMDLRSGGSSAGTWRLPKPKGVGAWASICAGRESIFAMEDSESPTLWRFTPTHELED
ncbi:unnamed protein product, partial [Prorocentrum cordatum]